MKPKSVIYVIALIFILGACANSSVNNLTKQANMELTSSAFLDNQLMPSFYTCDGANINPPLQIKSVPKESQSLVLIVDDPDALTGTWVHWLVWNIDPQTKTIEQNTFPLGSIKGTTSFGNTNYGGPCPPSGTHRYYFKLYALDTKLNLTPNAGKDNLEQAMQGHILASTQLIGLYKRGK